MRKKLIIVTIIFLITGSILTSCKESDLDIDTPVCIENKIEEIIKNKVSNPPTQVWKWEADENTYYYITSNCCDQYNYLYTENCDIVCAPDGGITGNGDGNCPIFNNEIIKTLVWEDHRN
jgi:uncharacterized protein DUF6970